MAAMIMRRSAVIALAAGLLLAAGCEAESDNLVIGGGGFVFNYRNAEATYGVVVGSRRALPDATVVEAEFENPDGGAPILVSKQVRPGVQRYDLQTPPLKGVVAGREYRVIVRLLDGAGSEIQRLEKTFTSELSQDVLPDKPLAIGPGYQKNLDGSSSPFPPSISRRPPETVPASGR